MTIVVTRHAAEQAEARASLDEAAVVEAVGLALREGRSSVERPGFLGPGSGARDAIYCWDAEQRAAFLLRGNGDQQVVVTVLSADHWPTAFEQAFARAGVTAAAVGEAA